MGSPVNSKNMYNVLYIKEKTIEKTVQFVDKVCLVDDEGSYSSEPIKIWDGASHISIIYTRLLYNFLNTPRSVTLSDRKKIIANELKDIDLYSKTVFTKEALNTCEKLANPITKNVPIWRKGYIGKFSFSFSTDDKSSIVWMTLFFRILKSHSYTH